MPRPQAGELLPGIDDGFAEPTKWSGWILAPGGHGKDWARVFGVVLDDAPLVFSAIHAASRTARIVNVRDLGRFGYTCGVDVEITVNRRTARVRASWHYFDEASTPRLVTAYPRT